jgi:YVTN family beta-propeller protein
MTMTRLAVLCAMLLLAAGISVAADSPPVASPGNFDYVRDNNGTFWTVCVNNQLQIYGSTPGHNFGFFIVGLTMQDCDKSDDTPRQLSEAQVAGVLASGNFFGNHYNLGGGAAPPEASSLTLTSGRPPSIQSLPFAPVYSRGTEFAAIAPCDPTLQPFSYVVNHDHDSVTAVSPCPARVTKVISVASRPLEVAMTPDATTAVVTSYDQALTFIDTASNNVSATMSVPPDLFPQGIAITPDGTRAYVTSFIDSGPCVFVVDLVGRKLLTRIPMPKQYPLSVTLTPDGSQAWVSFLQQDGIVIIDTLTNTIATTLSNLSSPVGIAFDAYGTKAYVVSSTSPGTLFVVNALTLDIVARVTVGFMPVDVNITPGGRWIFVTHTGSDYVAVIDADTNTIVDKVTVGMGSFGFTLVH